MLRELTETVGVVSGRRLFDMTAAGTTATRRSARRRSDPPRARRRRRAVADDGVRGGVEAAITRAREIAGDRNVTIASRDIAQQALDLGLVDEVCISLIPVLFGEGIPYFSTLDRGHLMLEDPVVVQDTAPPTSGTRFVADARGETERRGILGGRCRRRTSRWSGRSMTPMSGATIRLPSSASGRRTSPERCAATQVPVLAQPLPAYRSSDRPTPPAPSASRALRGSRHDAHSRVAKVARIHPGVEVATVPAVEGRLDGLHVLLRHRPPSIP